MLKRRDIRREISYDKKTGIIRCLYPVSMRENGHMRVNVKGITYRMTEIVWCLVHGTLPDNAKIVQLDGNKLNFNIDNLQLDNSKIISVEMSKRRGYDISSELYANKQRRK